MRKSTAGVRFPGTKECIVENCHQLRWDARGNRCAAHRFVCVIDGCVRSTQQSNGKAGGSLCWMHRSRKHKTGTFESLCDVDGCKLPNVNRSGKRRCEKHRGTTSVQGYRKVSVNGKTRSEHTIVVEARVGRKLLSHEQVHHKNGQKTDNRSDNLELWSKSQPSGQRVEDKIMWAVEFLETYGYAVCPPARAIQL